MSMSVEPVSAQALDYIIANIRESDAVEIRALSDIPIRQSLYGSVRLSNDVAIMMNDGVPVAVLGLVQEQELLGNGVPWLIGTNQISETPLRFVKECRKVVKRMNNICPVLVNYVHAKNEPSVRFLKHLGFKIDDPIPFGVSGELFHRFSMGEH